MSPNITKAFCSERLVYRAMEDNDEDKIWFHKIKNDPHACATADLELVRPQNRKRTDEVFVDINQSLVSAVICLPPASTTTTAACSGQENDEQHSKPDETASEPTPIGFICLREPSGPAYRNHHRECSLAIQIDAGYQNKGYGREAINWALDWDFTHANMRRVSLAALEHNERGRHLYEKLRFKYEGAFRKSHYHERRYWDPLFFSMLEEEWVELRNGTAPVPGDS